MERRRRPARRPKPAVEVQELQHQLHRGSEADRAAHPRGKPLRPSNLSGGGRPVMEFSNLFLAKMCRSFLSCLPSRKNMPPGDNPLSNTTTPAADAPLPMWTAGPASRGIAYMRPLFVTRRRLRGGGGAYREWSISEIWDSARKGAEQLLLILAARSPQF